MMEWTTWRKEGARDYPPTHPEYVLLMPAMDAIAKAVIQDWVGNEYAFEVAHMTRGVPSPAVAYASPEASPSSQMLSRYGDAVGFWLGRSVSLLHPPSYEEWREAYERFRRCFEDCDAILARKQAACRYVQQIAMTGALAVSARNEATGEMIQLPPELWNCDADIADARFARGRINLSAPMYPIPEGYVKRGEYHGRITSWLFVKKDHLAALLSELHSQGEAASAAPDKPLPHGPREPANAPSPSKEAGTGDPGRPEKGAVLYMVEFQRRISEGLAEDVLREEAKALLEWFQLNHPRRQAPTIGTIENRIRACHRKHRSVATK